MFDPLAAALAESKSEPHNTHMQAGMQAWHINVGANHIGGCVHCTTALQAF